MAMKVPLIVSDVHALEEIVCNGDAGYLHEAGNNQDLAKALHIKKKTLKNPKRLQIELTHKF